jgi:hypothetical protein
MKAHRIILVIEHQVYASILRVILENNGYRVLVASKPREGLTDGVDLVLIGHHIEFDESKCPIPSLRFSDMTVQQMLERIRILVVRKRGPKKGWKFAEILADRRSLA